MILLTTLLSLVLAQSAPIESAQDLYDCATNAAKMVCPDIDEALTAAYCCDQMSMFWVDDACQNAKFCREGSTKTSQALVYPVEGTSGTAAITSGEGGCVIREQEHHVCDDFSGNIDKGQYAYWKGTLIQSRKDK